MTVKELLKTIEQKEQVQDYHQITQKRWLEINNAKYIKKHIDFDETDIEFEQIYNYLATYIFTQSGLYKNVVVNILNRGYFI